MHQPFQNTDLLILTLNNMKVQHTNLSIRDDVMMNYVSIICLFWYILLVYSIQNIFMVLTKLNVILSGIEYKCKFKSMN